MVRGRRQKRKKRASRQDGPVPADSLPGQALDRRFPPFVFGVPFGVALCVYLVTVCPTVYWGDSAEFAVIGPELGVAHATGYPLFTLLGWLASWVPFGEIAWRVNLVSVVAGACAASAVSWVAWEARSGALAAVLVGLTFGVSQELWVQSTAAEVYGLHAALTACVLAMSFRFMRTRDARHLRWAALLLGLSFTNHLTSILTVPAVVLAAVLGLSSSAPVRPSLDAAPAGGDFVPVRGPAAQRWWLGTFALFCAPGLLYLYLPLRAWTGTLFDHGLVGTVPNLLAHVTGQQFRYRMFQGEAAGLAGETGKFLTLLGDQFTPWAVWLGLVGLVFLVIRDRKVAAVTGLLALADLAFTFQYNIPDKEGYYLPAYLVWSFWMAEAVAGVARWSSSGKWGLSPISPPGRGVWGLSPVSLPDVVDRDGLTVEKAGTVPSAPLHVSRPSRSQARRGWLVFALGAAVCVGPPLAANWSHADRSDNRSLPDFTRALLSSVEEGGLLVADDQFLLWAAYYLQRVEGVRPDVAVVNDYLLCLPWYVKHLRRMYPDLDVSSQVDDLVRQRGEEVARAAGWDVGEISQRYVEKITKVLLEDNLGKRPVHVTFHKGDERKEWLGYRLNSRGLSYEVVPAGAPTPAARSWPVDYPGPEGYRKPDIVGRHHRFVAGAFATSCNRSGILLVQEKRYEEAKAAFEKSLAYDPDYAQAHLNLGVVFAYHLPDATRRDRHWRRFVDLAPDDPQAPKVHAALENK